MMENIHLTDLQLLNSDSTPLKTLMQVHGQGQTN